MGIWSILVFILESAHIFTYEMIDKTFNFLFSKICSKPPIFLKKTFIISSFLARFQFCLIHMTDLLILYNTKKYIYIQKYSIQLYRAIFLAVFGTFGNLFQIEISSYNSKSIELRNLSKVIASCYRR